MANTPHPLDNAVIDLFTLKQSAIRHLGSDGEICARDRAIITEFRRLHREIGGYRKREVAADSYKRNGSSKHTNSLFRESGHRVIDFEDARQRRKVVSISEYQTHDEIG